MKPKKYSTHFAKLSNLILSMPEEQQAKLFDLASKMQNGEDLFANTVRKNTILFFTSGFAAGWGLVILLILILSAT